MDENFQTLTEITKNRSFKWDEASGQFSFSQEEEAHLQRAVEEMEEICRKSPDTVAVLLRQYSGETCSEVLTVTVHTNKLIPEMFMITIDLVIVKWFLFST